MCHENLSADLDSKKVILDLVRRCSSIDFPDILDLVTIIIFVWSLEIFST